MRVTRLLSRTSTVLFTSLVLVLPGSSAADNAVINVDISRKGPAVNPRLYGIFLEEINHGVDGGLYAELVRNRAFEDARPPEGYRFVDGHWRDAHGFDSGYSRYGYTTNGAPFWSLVQSGDARGSMHLETSGGITEESAYCLRLDVENAAGGRIGIANEGFFSIGIKEGESYSLSLHAKAAEGFNGPLAVRLEDASGTPCSTEVQLRNIRADWRKFEARLKGTRTEGKARLVILAQDNGKVWFDFVSLFPAQTWKGRANGLRPDLAQMIADLKPGFVRFPGGCVVEGGTVETAYNWKLTIGPVEHRQERWGPWNYRRTHGMGIFEYFQFCEDIGAEPLWVGFAGQTCIFREREHVPMSEMGWARDNFLDLVEYANGSPRSAWGRLRAQAGHRAPFNLKYVEIGNENQGREYGERYRFIHEAMKAKYPDIKYLADLSWTSRESLGDAVYNIEDRHYYNSPGWFVSRHREYDGRDRSLPPLYLGEVAVTSQEGGPTRGNLRAALAEGIFLMGCERNADTVSMVSYAPLLGHVEGRTELTGAPPPWHAMIYFDSLRSFGTVSYHLWKLFGENRPTRIVNTEVVIPAHAGFKVAGQIGVGTWNTSAEFKDIRVEKNGQTLYQSDFSSGAEGWQGAQRRGGGQWSVVNGAFRQGRNGRASRFIGDESWTDYTLTLKARKLSGNEGFLIIFGHRNGDQYWWNLGGWGNSQHAVEHSVQGSQTAVGSPVRGTIETERWYDIKVELAGNRIRCYLDGKLVHDVVAEPVSSIFAVAGTDDDRRELVLKVINNSAETSSSTVRIEGARLRTEGTMIRLTSAEPTDNNSLDNPTNVMPSVAPLKVHGPVLQQEFPPHSLTILRISMR